MIILESILAEIQEFFGNKISVNVAMIFLVTVVVIFFFSIIGYIRVMSKTISTKDYERMRKIHKEKGFYEKINNTQYRENKEE